MTREPELIVKVYRWAKARAAWVIAAAILLALLVVMCGEATEPEGAPRAALGNSAD